MGINRRGFLRVVGKGAIGAAGLIVFGKPPKQKDRTSTGFSPDFNEGFGMNVRPKKPRKRPRTSQGIILEPAAANVVIEGNYIDRSSGRGIFIGVDPAGVVVSK